MKEKSESFTCEELEMLSDGILSMMENINRAMTLTKNLEIHKLMTNDLEKCCVLNNKITRMMGETVEGGEIISGKKI